MVKDLLDPNSSVSSVRAAMFLALFAAIVIALVGLVKGSELGGLGILCGVFVGPAFGAKVWQKANEKQGGE